MSVRPTGAVSSFWRRFSLCDGGGAVEAGRGKARVSTVDFAKRYLPETRGRRPGFEVAVAVWGRLSSFAMRAFALASLAALVFPGALAAAQEHTEEARVHFEAAVDAYDRGAYEAAERDFGRAYELSEHPDLLYNVYLAAERAGHLAAAGEALEQYLAEGDMSDERRGAFEQRLARLRARIEAAEVDGEVGEVTPRDVAVASEGDELATPVIFVKRGRIHPAATALFVAAGAFAVSFAVAAGLSEAEDRSLAGDCGRDTDFPNCADDELDSLQRRNLVADISWIGALVAAGAGLVVFFTTKDDDGEVSASVGLGSVSLQGRF